MRERVIVTEPQILVYANNSGEIVLEQVGDAIRIPYDKIHQLTVWMRRIAAEFEGIPIPE
jgi:quercetin dioxygenase-like cupin family protein